MTRSNNNYVLAYTDSPNMCFGYSKNHLIEMVLLNNHNTYFGLEKNSFDSQLPPLIPGSVA